MLPPVAVSPAKVDGATVWPESTMKPVETSFIMSRSGVEPDCTAAVYFVWTSAYWPWNVAFTVTPCSFEPLYWPTSLSNSVAAGPVMACQKSTVTGPEDAAGVAEPDAEQPVRASSAAADTAATASTEERRAGMGVPSCGDLGRDGADPGPVWGGGGGAT